MNNQDTPNFVFLIEDVRKLCVVEVFLDYQTACKYLEEYNSMYPISRKYILTRVRLNSEKIGE